MAGDAKSGGLVYVAVEWVGVWAMSTAVRKRMTIEAFLDWENQQEERWEFDGFQPVAMTGGTLNHGLVQSNLIAAVSARLRGGPCRVFGSHLKILVAGSVRYPDAFVLCSPAAGSVTHVSEPVVVFEILSPSTSRADRIIKNREYRDTPSIRRYVILEQDAQAALAFHRADGDWVAHQFMGDTELSLPEIGISVPLAEIYEGVELAVESTEDVLPVEVPRPAGSV